MQYQIFFEDNNIIKWYEIVWVR